MARRRPGFRYSRWDGTQTGFDLDAESLLDEMSDDLLYHGDLNAALRRMMQQGFQDRDGNRLQGMREMLEQLRALENGGRIKVVDVKESSIGVDTAEDFERGVETARQPNSLLEFFQSAPAGGDALDLKRKRDKTRTIKW